MRLIITRRGETEENKAGIMQGHLPGTLSELGKEQAGKLAERLKDEKIDLIVSSDLARALDTAKVVAEFHPGVELVLDERLRERFWGEFDGKTPEEVGCPKNKLIWDYATEESAVEDGNIFFARARALVEDVLKRPEENILLVGHNWICKAVLENLLGVRDLREIVGLKNTSVSVFEDGEMKLLNCVEHLV